MAMHIARFRDSRMAVARRKTEQAAWRAAQAHGLDLGMLEVVPEDQHEEDRGNLPDYGSYQTFFNATHQTLKGRTA
jgi:hypothetical protein